jgi:hypothetical protein
MEQKAAPAVGALEKSIAAIFALIGQAPWASTMLGYPLSLYQPGIYRGKEWFVVFPVMVGVFATWAAIQSRAAMWVIFLLFILLTGLVYYLYTNFPPISPVHPVNWILSYCAFALLFAALARLFIDLMGVGRTKG